MTMGQPWYEDEIFSWPVRRFMTRLAFMKKKNAANDLIEKLKPKK